MGCTYEISDQYACLWFETQEGAEKMRDLVNTLVGWPVLSKTEFHSVESDSNPFTRDAACTCPLPEKTAKKHEKHGGWYEAFLADCKGRNIVIR